MYLRFSGESETESGVTEVMSANLALFFVQDHGPFGSKVSLAVEGYLMTTITKWPEYPTSDLP